MPNNDHPETPVHDDAPGGASVPSDAPGGTPVRPDAPGGARRRWRLFGFLVLLLLALHAPTLLADDPRSPWPHRGTLYWLVLLLYVTWLGVYARGRWLRLFGRLAMLAAAAFALLALTWSQFLLFRYGELSTGTLALVRTDAFLEQWVKLSAVLLIVTGLTAGVAAALRHLLRMPTHRGRDAAPAAVWKRLTVAAARLAVLYLVGLPWLFVFMQVHQPKLDYAAAPWPPFTAAADLDAAALDAAGLPQSGWIMPARVPSDTVVVLCHGVGADQADMLDFADMFRSMGCHVVSFDWPAHGRADGVVTTYGGREWIDAVRTAKWLRSLPAAEQHRRLLGRPPRRVIGFGVSMGGHALLQAASRYPALFDGLIIDSGYASADAMAEHRLDTLPPAAVWPVRHATGRALFWWETGLRLSTIDVTPRLPLLDATPKLLIHCEGDRIVPIAQGRAIRDACDLSTTTWLEFPDGHHIAAHATDPKAYEVAVRALLTWTGHKPLSSDE